MRITIRAMCQKRDDLNKQIRSELSKICPAISVQSIRTKIQEVNSKLFNHLHQKILSLSDAEKSVLSKGLNFVPISKNLDESRLSKMLKNFFAAFNLKPFSMTKRMILTPRTRIFSRRSDSKIEVDSPRGPVRLFRFFHQ